MTKHKNPKYAAMRQRRSELGNLIHNLYGELKVELARDVQVAFLRYEGAVLQLLQDDLDAIDILVQRVEIEEGANDG